MLVSVLSGRLRVLVEVGLRDVVLLGDGCWGLARVGEQALLDQ